MFIFILAAFILVCGTILYLHFYHKRTNDVLLNGEHFMISGGSKGIGLAVATEVVRRGGSVTLIARNKENLDSAKAKLSHNLYISDQKIFTFAADVSADISVLKEAVAQAEEEVGPITWLVNCAGSSICYRFDETPTSEFQKMMNLNFLGSVSTTQAVLPLMKKRRRGKIIFVSSLAGLAGLYGYSAYSASKFALMGMAQSLQMEVKPYGVSITVSCPPDTDTPGYAEELKSKLTETRLISETAGLVSAQEVAKKMINDALSEQFMSLLGFEGWAARMLFCGATPVSSYFDLIMQIFTMGLARLMIYKYITDCERIIKKCFDETVDAK